MHSSSRLRPSRHPKNQCDLTWGAPPHAIRVDVVPTSNHYHCALLSWYVEGDAEACEYVRLQILMAAPTCSLAAGWYLHPSNRHCGPLAEALELQAQMCHLRRPGLAA
eukprot:8640539-Pyramimonas_sp.AAC.1